MSRPQLRLLCLAGLLAGLAAPPRLARAQAPTRTPRAVLRQAEDAFLAGREATLRVQLAAAERQGDHLASLALASLDRLAFAYDSADRRLRLLARDTGEAGRVATGEYGLSLLTQGGAATAESLFARLAPSATAAGDRGTASVALAQLAALRERRVGPSVADSLARLALATAPDAWLAAGPRCQVAYLAVRLGNPAAGALALAAADSARAAGHARALALCVMARAVLFDRKGESDSTLAALIEVAAAHRAMRNWAGLAAVQQWAGYTRQLRGELGEARRLLREAIALATRVRQPSVIAWSHLNLAEVALRLNDAAESIDEAEASRAIAEQLGDKLVLAFAERARADALYQGDRFDAAERRYRHSLDLLSAAGNDVATVHVLTRLASLARRRGALAEADSVLRMADARSHRLDVSGGSDLELEHASLRAAQGDLAGASRLYAALLKAEPRSAQAFDIQVRLAELLARRGHVDSAGRLLAAADASLSAWRATLTERDLRANWLQVRRLDWDADLGAATIISALAGAGRSAAAFDLAERRRARALVDEVTRRASLSGASMPATSPTASADSVRAALPDSTALIFFVTGDGGEPTTAFTLTRGGVVSERLAPADSLRAAIDRFASLASAGEPAADLARQLAALVLPRDVRELVPGLTHLVVVADGPLHRLPLELLPLADGRALFRHAAVSSAPSATLALRGWRRPPSAGTRVLAFGNPSMPPARTTGGVALSALPGAGAEARAAAAYSATGVAHLGREATEAAFRRADLRDLAVLHFATHALVVPHSPSRSGLVLAPGDGEDGFVSMDELGARAVDVALVVLSACHTAEGELVAGEGVQGIVTPLLEAGARAVLATRWALRDAPSGPVLQSFYEGLAAQLPADEALRRAKVAAADAGVSRAVWGAFVLVGDGRVTVPLTAPSAWRRFWRVTLRRLVD